MHLEYITSVVDLTEEMYSSGVYNFGGGVKWRQLLIVYENSFS